MDKIPETSEVFHVNRLPIIYIKKYGKKLETDKINIPCEQNRRIDMVSIMGNITANIKPKEMIVYCGYCKGFIDATSFKARLLYELIDNNTGEIVDTTGSIINDIVPTYPSSSGSSTKSYDSCESSREKSIRINIPVIQSFIPIENLDNVGIRVKVIELVNECNEYAVDEEEYVFINLTVNYRSSST